MLNLEGMRILVTGGAGAVGTNLVIKLLQIKDVEVVVLDDLSSGTTNGIDLERIKFYKSDLNDDKVLNDIFSSRVDVVFHLAAHFANQNSIDHPLPDLFSNTVGTLKLLEKCLKANVSKFVYTNTSCMCAEGATFGEDDTNFEYHTPYAISKHTAEKYVLFYNNYYKLPSVSIRIFNSYGPHEYPGEYRNVIPNFINKALNGDSLPIMGDGTDTRSFTYVLDLVEGLINAASSSESPGEIINLGNDNETKIIDLASMINNLTNNTAPLIFVPKRDWDKTTRRFADISKARSMLKYENRTTLESGLGDTIAWFKSLDSK